jgi:hypothetical protein
VVVGLVELGADDRLDSLLLGRLVEVEDPVHVAVIGDPHRRLTVGRGGGDHIGHPRRAIEHRELGVQMEMGEGIGHPWDSGSDKSE